jgi:hypothetical protein
VRVRFVAKGAAPAPRAPRWCCAAPRRRVPPPRTPGVARRGVAQRASGGACSVLGEVGTGSESTENAWSRAALRCARRGAPARRRPAPACSTGRPPRPRRPSRPARASGGIAKGVRNILSGLVARTPTTTPTRVRKTPARRCHAACARPAAPRAPQVRPPRRQQRRAGTQRWRLSPPPKHAPQSAAACSRPRTAPSSAALRSTTPAAPSTPWRPRKPSGAKRTAKWLAVPAKW